MSSPPAAAVISASAMVDTLNLWMPAARFIAITWGNLWVLTCGRRRPTSPAMVIMRRRFCSIRSGYSNTVGELMASALEMAYQLLMVTPFVRWWKGPRSGAGRSSATVAR